MLAKTLEDLGFNRICEDICALCLSEEGTAELDRKIFITDDQDLARQQDLVGDLLAIQSFGIPSPESFPPLGKLLEDLATPEARLDGEQLYDLGMYLRSARLFTQFCRSPHMLPGSAAPDEAPLPASTLFDPFPTTLAHLEDTLLDVLEAPGTVKNTHPAIRSLKVEIEKRRTERQSYSMDFLHTQSSLAQSDQPVFRDGRVVLPVKNDQRKHVDGFIHSTSSSGNTVFIEPYRLVELNNRVVLAEQQVLIEIARILAELSQEARFCLEAIQVISKKIAVADALYARSQYILKHNCVRALVSPDRSYRLINARHPLLRGKVVPISMILDSSVKAVVLSGPNAGGKTVTIKTLGLFALLNQYLYFVPASEGTMIPIYHDIFTDIGDDQSIETSLSTFSGHMRQIGEILRFCDGTSLVILDELGSGTDPIEGSALARAVMEYCVQHAGLTLVTSHHSVLKQYAYAHKQVLNASMEFNNANHEPTFKVISGVPGDSHALDTARRMNLPDSVITAAEGYLGSEALEISSIIKALEERREEAEKREAAMEERSRMLQQEVRQIDLKNLKLRQQEMLLRREQLGDLSRFISTKRGELENLVSDLRQGEITREKTLKVKSFIASMELKEQETRTRIMEMESNMVGEQYANGDTALEAVGLKVGMDVLAGPQKREGRIVRKAKGDSWVVAIGPIKFTLSGNDLKPIGRQGHSDRGKVSVMYETGSATPKPVIDVRGMTLQESLEVLATQIEGALVHSIGEFSIIHGMGDGILSKGIHDYLRGIPQVSEYYFARPEDGGYGKTYVVL